MRWYFTIDGAECSEPGGRWWGRRGGEGREGEVVGRGRGGRGEVMGEEGGRWWGRKGGYVILNSILPEC